MVELDLRKEKDDCLGMIQREKDERLKGGSDSSARLPVLALGYVLTPSTSLA